MASWFDRNIGDNPIRLAALGIATTLALIGLLALSACGDDGETKQDGDKTGYDNIRVQQIDLAPYGRQGQLLCVSGFFSGSGYSISCDWAGTH